MWAKRLAASVVAIALVVGAVVARRRIDGGSASSTASTAPAATGGNGSSSAPASTNPATALTIVCVPELVDACRAAAAVTTPTITVRVEAAGTTRATLAAADDPASVLSGWVTFAPWAELADASRGRATPPRAKAFAVATALGRSPVTLAVKANRYEVLSTLCAGTITWSCVGDHAGKPWSTLGGQASWGALYPGHGDPTASASGLAALAAIVVQRLGNSTFTATDLDADSTFDAWITGFERSVPRSAFDSTQGTPLQQLLAEPRYSVVAASGAEIAEIPAGRASEIKSVVPAPAVAAEAVLVATTGTALPAAVTAAIGKAVQAAGWQAPSADATNAPTPTTMEALQQAWLRWR